MTRLDSVPGGGSWVESAVTVVVAALGPGNGIGWRGIWSRPIETELKGLIYGLATGSGSCDWGGYIYDLTLSLVFAAVG
jgi:hypothetical protein